MISFYILYTTFATLLILVSLIVTYLVAATVLTVPAAAKFWVFDVLDVEFKMLTMLSL